MRLDFMHPFPRPHWLARLLLAAGLGVAAWAGWQGRQAQQALDAAVAAAPQAIATAARRSVRATVDEGQAAVRAAREQLAAPWGELFVRLETSRSRRIALVALEADGRKPEAILTAETRSAKDMLAYIEQLKISAGFASVTLASHAVQMDDPRQPLRFVLHLRWRA